MHDFMKTIISAIKYWIDNNVINKIDEISKRVVQPDWNQNDSTAPDYVKNRIAYCSSSKSYYMDDFDDINAGWYFYHVSDDIPTYEIVTSGKIRVNMGGYIYEDLGVVDSEDFIAIYNNEWHDTVPDYESGYFVVIAKTPGAVFYGQVFETTGVYLFKDSEYGYSDTVLSCEFGVNIKTLPLEVLPVNELQADWNDWNETSLSYIKNKPNVALKSDVTTLRDKLNKEALLVKDVNASTPLLHFAYSISFTNGIFFMRNQTPDSTGYTFMYSHDGVNWHRDKNVPVGYALVYGNGKFVSLNRDKNKIIYSTDLINWVEVSLDELCPEAPNAVNPINSITYGNGRFVAATNYGFLHSFDAINWTFFSAPIINHPNTGHRFFMFKSIAYGNGKFIARADQPYDRLLISNDGITWELSTSIENIGDDGVLFAKDRFFIINTSDTRNNNTIKSSYDFINWTDIPNITPLAIRWRSMIYGDNKFVLLGETTSASIAFYSEDGINWTQVVLPSDSYYDISYGNGRFVAIGDSFSGTHPIIYSSDGINWSRPTGKEIKLNNVDVTEIIDNNKAYTETDHTLSKIGMAADAKATMDAIKRFEYSPKSHFILTDDSTSCEYIVRMQNGILTSTCKASSIAVTTKPNKVSYVMNDTFDSTGMVVTLARQDGSTEEISNYTYTQPNLIGAYGTMGIEVSYVEAGEIYTDVFTIDVAEK